MDKPYQLVLDIWEGNPDLDVQALKAAGVAGMIVRLNDMNGGHHMDERFGLDWATAKLFDAQSIYFVYNPWVSGRENFDWLVAHLPADFDGRRLLIDTEVKYPGYAPEDYAKETLIFYNLVSRRFPEAIYTGEWFLSLVAKWPTDIEYWWAAYPDALQGHTSWESLRAAVEKMIFENWTTESPGPVRLWQCSGGGNVLPGFGKHGVDISVFPGSLDELKKWLNVPESGGSEMGVFSTNAVGPYLDDRHNLIDKAPMAGNIDCIIADAGSWKSRALQFTNHIQLAADLKVPLIARFVIDPEPCVQWTFNSAVWPDADHDFQIQALDRQLKSGTAMRTVHAIMLDASKVVQDDGKSYLTSNWVKAIAQRMMDLCNDRYHLPLYLFIKKESVAKVVEREGSSNPLTEWLAQQPTICTWASAFLSNTVTEMATWGTLPIPGDTWTPGQPYATGWDFARYANTKFLFANINSGLVAVPLFIYRNTPDVLDGEVHYQQPGDPGQPPEPPTPPTDGTQQDRIEAMVKESWEILKAIKDL